MIIEGVTIAELTSQTVLATNGLGRKVIGGIEGHEKLRAKDPQRRQHAALFQTRKDLKKHGIEVAGGDRIEQLADLIVTRNLRHVEEGVDVILAFGTLQPALVFQKQWGLGKKDAKGAQNGIVDSVLGIGTRFAMVREVRDILAQDALKGIEA
jgi:hypothetical protein